MNQKRRGFELRIHRGCHEIGGSCFELSTENSKVFFDLGLPLDGRAVDLPSGLERSNGIVLSHCHGDHTGLLDRIWNNMPVYASETTRHMMDAQRIFSGRDPLDLNWQFFRPWKAFSVGDFHITPYLMDHTSLDAFAFLVKAREKALFYSGDFRGHGRKGILLQKLMCSGPKHVDVMLLEGTMMKRDNTDYPSETSVEEGVQSVLASQTQPAFLVCSAQNVDRMVSAYRACKRTGRVLVVDLYTAFILDIAQKVSSRIPHPTWDDVKVLGHHLVSKSQYLNTIRHYERFKDFNRMAFSPDHGIAFEEVQQHGPRYLLKIPPRLIPIFIRQARWDAATVVYSQWQGYLDPEIGGQNAVTYQAMIACKDIGFFPIHTTGHAPREDLARLVTAIQPKTLIPIHTEAPEGFTGLGAPVVFLTDGEAFWVR